MRSAILLALAGLLPLPVAAQTRVAAGVGGTWSSTLVTDQIVNPVNVRASLAPTLSLEATIPSGPRYRVGIAAAITLGSVHAEENGVTTDLGGLRTGSIQLIAEGPAMLRHLYWRAGVGLLAYWPGRKEGLFLQGGPTRLMGSFGLDYRLPWRDGWEWTASARYAYHRFTTAQLQSRGFSQAQDVHRLGLQVGAARYF